MQEMTLMEQIKLVQEMQVTLHKSTKKSHSKLDGVSSVSTSPLKNKFCLAHRDIPGSICQKCYSCTMQKRFSGLAKRMVRNYEIMTTYLISQEAWALLPISTLYARVESFGDTENVTQALNYIRIIRSHPSTKWAVWTKNPQIWYQAFEQEGKPDNCTFVISSLLINKVDTFPERIMKYTDHIFTVYDKPYIKEHSVDINCGGRLCMGCLTCYKRGTEVQIREELK